MSKPANIEGLQKVINGLECCIGKDNCDHCSYDSAIECDLNSAATVPLTVLQDAIGLLKAQKNALEAMKNDKYLADLAVLARETWHEEVPVPLWVYVEMVRSLKAQEPRVLTLEEVRKTPYSIPIYCECLEGYVHTALIIPMQRMRVRGFIEMYTDNEEIGLLNYEVYLIDSYAKTWRCWNKRPSDAKRRATPWND